MNCIVALLLCASVAAAQTLGPTVTKTFSPSTVFLGGTSTLSLTLSNPNANTTLTHPSVEDTFSTSLFQITFNPVFSPACPAGSSVTVVGGSVLTFASPSLAPGGSCNLQLTVTALAAGDLVNTTAAPTSDQAGGQPASATLHVLLAAPVLSKSFGAPSVTISQSTIMTFTITNPNTQNLTAVAFTDALPTGLVADGQFAAINCGAVAVNAAAGSHTISVSGATVVPGTPCIIQVEVTADGAAVGPVVNITSAVTATGASPGDPATAQIFIAAGDAFQVRYVANLDMGDSVVNITNPGSNGASLFGPGYGAPVGNICVNVYAFSPDEQLVACCSCLLTPNGLASLSVNTNIRKNTLTGVAPSSMVVKLLATAAGPGFAGTSCTGSAAAPGSIGFPVAIGMSAWATTVHQAGLPAAALTETPFTRATLSAEELASLGNRCSNIIGNGSTYGICRDCIAGALGGSRQ